MGGSEAVAVVAEIPRADTKKTATGQTGGGFGNEQ
jgi:hypothetical protein